MKLKKILTLLTAAVLVTSTLLTGCGGDNKESATSGKVKDKIVCAIKAPPTGVFNPLIANTAYDSAVNDLIYSGMLSYDKDYNLQPELAEEYKVSDDNLKYTFKLKKDLKWQDGKPLTTKDIEYTFKAIANPNYDENLKSVVQNIKGVKDFAEGKTDKIEGIKVIDDSIIEFTLDKVYSIALGDIGATAILPEHIWGSVSPEKWGESSDLLSNPVGCGPYKLVKFESGQSVEFERNDNFYGNKAKTDKFIFKVTNADTIQGELTNGTVDIADVSTLKKAERDDIKSQGFNLVSYPEAGIVYMGMNLRNEKFKDVKVRQAINYGINKKEALDKLSEGNGTLVSVPILPSGWAYPKDGELNDYSYNTSKAKELLKEAGWEDRDNDGILENSKNEKFKVKLHCPSGRKDQEQRAVLIQSNLKEIGVDVEILTMEFSALMQQVVGNHEFDMYMMVNTLPIDPDPKAFWYSTAASDEKNNFGWNISSYKNPEVDKLIDEGLNTMDKNKRKEIYGEYAKIMNRDIPWVCFFASNTVQAVNPKLNNYHPNTNQNLLDVENWYVEE